MATAKDPIYKDDPKNNSGKTRRFPYNANDCPITIWMKPSLRKCKVTILPRKNALTCVELCAGGGGLALGASLSGIRNTVSVELDSDACNTLRLNSARIRGTRPPNLIEGDIRSLSLSNFVDPFDVLIGGPPCQPFSMGGLRNGHADKRDLFPEYFRILQSTLPKAFLIENVQGLASNRFQNYLDYLLLQLRFIDSFVFIQKGWFKRYRQLIKDFAGNTQQTYRVYAKVLNAVDYGVGQIRRRLFIIGIRSDINADWTWPLPTHSFDTLLYEKYVTGEYFERHSIKPKSPPTHLIKRVKAISIKERPALSAHQTVRDVLSGLPEPIMGEEYSNIPNHIGIPGARAYPGHSGSSYDWPSKTIKAGVNGCPGGENILIRDSRKIRYYTVRESARLQTFPDSYVFSGSRSKCMKQIGNAVPVKLARVLLNRLSSILLSTEQDTGSTENLYPSACLRFGT